MCFSLVIAYLMNLASIHIFKHIPYYLGNIPLGVSFMAISSFLQRYKQSAWILIVTIPLWLLNVFYFESFWIFGQMHYCQVIILCSICLQLQG